MAAIITTTTAQRPFSLLLNSSSRRHHNHHHSQSLSFPTPSLHPLSHLNLNPLKLSTKPPFSLKPLITPKPKTLCFTSLNPPSPTPKTPSFSISPKTLATLLGLATIFTLALLFTSAFPSKLGTLKWDALFLGPSHLYNKTLHFFQHNDVVCSLGNHIVDYLNKSPGILVDPPLYAIATGISKWLDIYSGVLMVRVLLSWFPNMPWKMQPFSAIRDLCDPYLSLFRHIVPPVYNAVDVSPLFAFSLLGFVSSILNCAKQL